LPVTAKEIFGCVQEIKGSRALVQVYEGQSKRLTGEVVDALNLLGAKKDDVVKILPRKISARKDRLTMLLVPLLTGVVGLLFGYRMAIYTKQEEILPVIVFGAALWLIPGGIYARRYWRDVYQRGMQPTIVDIVRRGK
jgi:hypothetical protein